MTRGDAPRKMISRVLVLLALALLGEEGVAAPTARRLSPQKPVSIAAALAEPKVEVKVNYSGARIVLFVASSALNDASAGFAVALVGPTAPQTVVRQTDRGRESFEFVSAPVVMAIGAEPNVSEVATPAAMINAGLNAASAAMPAPDRLDDPRLAEWRNAFVDLKVKEGLYSLQDAALERLAGGLMRAKMNLPGSAPPGDYKVRAAVFKDGKLIGSSETTLNVRRGGLDATLYDLAHDHGLIYGLVAVAIGAGLGAIGGSIGRR